MPVVGFLSSGSQEFDASRLRAFHQGLNEAGYVEGRNVAIEVSWAENHTDQLPALAAKMASRSVTVITAAGINAALAAKIATTTIPIVFVTGVDPVETGLVASLSRPGGNLTGVTDLAAELGQKHLELLHEAVTTASIVALLVNPANPNAKILPRELQAAAPNLGLVLHVLHASSERDFATAFAALGKLRAGALVIGTDAIFNRRSERLGALTVQHAVPAIHALRPFVIAGGLMSYGGSLTDSYHLAGTYTGKILNGARPADLPVQQSTKVELIINMKTARLLGLTIAPALLARADEVIE
jgi:putative tryptophan/tyrosine transport system substrate-binding protein